MANLVSERDAALFVGRGDELALLEALLTDDPPLRVVHVHGPGGIGKSALLREFSRRALSLGGTVSWVDGRELSPVPGALEAALAAVRDAPAPIVVLDTYERMAALDTFLRHDLLPRLPARTVVVIAGRRPPADGWFQHGWEAVCAELPLKPLEQAEGEALLAARGVADPVAAQRMAAWAAGSPLALAILAGSTRLPGRFHPERRDVVATLVQRLLDEGLDERRLDVLAVAANARSVTPSLLRAALPDRDAEEAHRWLAERSYAEPLGAGVALHDLVRRTLRADLRHRIPQREGELRRRVADHLHARALDGELELTIDLAELVADDVIRSGYSWDGALRNRIDRVRPGDADAVRRRLEPAGAREWWPEAEPWFAAAPETISIARDVGDRLCGYSIAVTPAGAPPLARADPVLGPWLEHAGGAGHESAVLWREAWDFTGDPRSGVRAMVAMSGILRARLPNPRYAYLPIEAERPAARAFSRALGGRRIEDLDVEVGPLRFELHVVDWGPGGLLGAQRDVVYRELGMPPPHAAPAPAEVRDALRALHRPGVLARSPLAAGGGEAERAAALRARLEGAIDDAFGQTHDERALRDVLVRSYVDPAPSGEQAAHDLHLSRATYYRRLRVATERVAAFVAQR